MNRISEKIRHIGINDHKTELFEGLWSLPYGVSYNSYLILDEKTALVDTAEAAYSEEFFRELETELGDKSVDYVIVNHMEPDHSALLSELKRKYPSVRIVCSAKAAPMIAGYHGIAEDIQTVKDGESLSLGGSTLTFYMTPMLHWPETMMTYLNEEKTLFSGDAFGSFMATDGEFIDGFDKFEEEMSRYYACIVGKYGSPVQTALKKLGGLEICRICSTHGPVWEKDIEKTIGLYDRLSKYEPVRKGVCIVYGSMYGNTEKAALALSEALDRLGIENKVHNLSVENVSYAYRDAFRYSHIAAGSPTYNNDIYPPVYSFMYGLGARQLKNRQFYAFGSYTWAGASVRLLNEMAAKFGFGLSGDGLSFCQGYSPDKCDMSETAEKIASECK